jgi:hypothetical protein
MDQDLLNQRMASINDKIAKINKRIQKHKDRQNEAAFIKDQAPWYSQDPKSIKTMQQLIQARWDNTDKRYADDPKYHTTIDDTKKRIEQDYQGFISEEQREVTSAERDLEDAQAVLAKYQSQLDSKAAFDKEEKIKIIWNFLQSWKNQVHSWIIINAGQLKDLKADEDNSWKEYVQKHDLQDVVANHNEYWEKKQFIKDYYAGINPLTYEVIKRDYSVDEELLNKKLDEDVKIKYDYFIKQIKDLAGEIVDASGLTISPKGEINGLVHGTLNDVNVWTTLSGGQIQCLHYRVYCHIAH